MRFVPVFAGIGAAALLAGVSVVAADSHNAHGKAVSAVATSKATEGEAHGDAVSTVAREHEDSLPTALKPVVRTPEPKPAVSDACRTALAKAKVAIAADRVEDRSERKPLEAAGSTQPDEIAPTAANRLADQAEDASELTALRNAVTSVRAACVRPEVLEGETTGCIEAETTLETVQDRQATDIRLRVMTPTLLTFLQRATTRLCGA